MVRVARILKDFRETGALNSLIALWGFVDETTFLTKAGAVGVLPPAGRGLRMSRPSAAPGDRAWLRAGAAATRRVVPGLSVPDQSAGARRDGGAARTSGGRGGAQAPHGALRRETRRALRAGAVRGGALRGRRHAALLVEPCPLVRRVARRRDPRAPVGADRHDGLGRPAHPRRGASPSEGRG